MPHLIAWYLIVSVAGWLAFPVAFRLLPGLPDRGYVFSRTLGLLLWGFAFWLLASLGVLSNDPGGLLLALALLVGLSAWLMRRGGLAELVTWLRRQGGLVLSVELLFLVAFAAWAFVRAANPEATGTEKPMELAFINSILRSTTFPPHDPWLSGYAISYYYFGYVLVGMVAKLAGTPGGVAFNLGISLVFALSALGTYGLVYDLLSASTPGKRTGETHNANLLAATFGPLFTLIVSNAEGFLHALHNRGLFWSPGPGGGLTSAFWKWLDMNELSQPPAGTLSWVPDKFWWWWRASRVVTDYDLARNPKEIIDEFPFFSYLLADLHPHVLAMPFAFLAIALALNVFLGGGAGQIGNIRRGFNLCTVIWAALLGVTGGIALIWLGAGTLHLSTLAAGIVALAVGLYGLLVYGSPIAEYGASVLLRNDLGTIDFSFSIPLGIPAYLLGAVVLGGMAFLNTWDFPVYVALFAAAGCLNQLQRSGWGWYLLRDFILTGLALGLGGGLLYLPFYLGFSSQAGGILPNLVYPTRGAHLWVMFGTLLLPLFAFLVYLARTVRSQPVLRSLWRGIALALVGAMILWVLAILLGLGIMALPEVGDLFMSTLAASGRGQVLSAAISRRFQSPGGWITLVLLLGLTTGLLILAFPRPRENSADEGATQIEGPFTPDRIFALLLILMGGLLVFGPEFFFLRDQFGWRINTIFKFYFQAWLFWSVAAAYGASLLLRQLRRVWNTLFTLGLTIVLLVGLTYPVFSLWNKTNGFGNPQEWTLDGTAYFGNQSPDEQAAVRWLQAAPVGPVAEAVSPTGGSYSNFARISMLSGQPGVLGWTGHESQWRGGSIEMGSRQADLERLYCTKDWNEASTILSRYDIRYVYIGSLERSTYLPGSGACGSGLYEAKFSRFLSPVFHQGDVVIYEVPGVVFPVALH